MTTEKDKGTAMPAGVLPRMEKYLAARAHAIERDLPLDGGASPLWDEYERIAGTLTAIRSQLSGAYLARARRA